MGLSENRTGPVHYLKYSEWEFPKNEATLCVQKALKVTVKEAIVHQDKEQSKEQDEKIVTKTIDVETLQDAGARMGEMLKDPE